MLFGFTNNGDAIFLGFFNIGLTFIGNSGFLLRLLLGFLCFPFASFAFGFGAFQAFEVDCVVAGATATGTGSGKSRFFSRYFIINLSLFGFIRKRIRCFEGERFSNEFGEFSSIHDANWLIFQKVNMFCYPLKHTPQKLRSFFLRSPVKIDAVR